MKHCRIFLLLTSLLLLSGIACKQPTVTNSTSNYSIYFDPNGGTGTMSPVTGAQNTRVSLPKCTFTNGDLIFFGWATAPNTGMVASDEAEFLLSKPKTTLYAIWINPAVKYVTVTFYPQNGTNMKVQQNIEENKTTKLNAIYFSYEGHRFAGWATSAGSKEVKYTDGQEVTLTKDLDLYAVWEETGGTSGTGVLTFDANGGSGTMEPVTGLADGGSYTLPKNTFTKEGYVFIGWTFTKGSATPDYQDQSSFYNYYAGTSKLYAVWAEKEEVICISFDANGGSGTKDSIYVKRGEKFQMPSNTFTPPADKPYYTCNSYGTSKSPDTMSTYKFSGFYSFTDDTVLYAYWTPPSDPSLGGASEKYKGKTVFFEGVNIKPEDWEKVSDKPLHYFAEWKQDCGWYDTSQGTFNFCWAGTASNVIHWWLDRNADYINRYYELKNESKPDFSYKGKGQSNIFALFVSTWTENKGGYPQIGFNWFININDNDLIQSSAKGKAGYFKEVFGETSLSEYQKQLNRRNFNTFIAKALEENKLISIDERNLSGAHSITCWGFDFDEEGYICALYYTDSATDWNNHFTGKELCLGKITVKYDEKWVPYMETETLIGSEVKYGRVDIETLRAYSQGTEYWESYFANHPVD